jgi:hypothetical protein
MSKASKLITLTEIAGLSFFVSSIVFLAFVFYTDFGTQPKRTIALLKSQGYSDIHLTGYKVFACGRGDFFSSGFKAVKDGQQIEGVVCSGLFKGATIRFEY